MIRSAYSTWLLAALVAGAALSLAGCSDLLEPEVYSDLTPETFFSSEADFRSAVVALYNPLMVDWGTQDQGAGQWYSALYNHDVKTYWARSEHTTDELYTSWVPTFTNFTWGPATLAGDQMSTYSKIRYVARATDVIDKIQNSEADVPASVRETYVAEARTLRAWLMYALYDFFGAVNVKLDPETLDDTEITPRPAPGTAAYEAFEADYLDAMEQDLLAAIPLLPAMYNGDVDNWGRVSQGTARMLLLRLYMHTRQWTKAEQVARDITSMGYALVDDYADICNVEQNEELIYAVPASAASPNWYWMEVLPGDFAEAGDIRREPGWGGYVMRWDFYDMYEAGDERLTTILTSYTNTSGNLVTREQMGGAIPLKCTTNLGGSEGAPADWPVFRYAEALLSLSEAINEQRGPGEALEYVNMVRERAELAPWNASDFNQEQLRDSLLVERGRELYAEGVRRQDLIRHGKYIEYAQQRGASAEAHEVLFPIPLSVVQQSDGLVEQNPGY